MMGRGFQGIVLLVAASQAAVEARGAAEPAGEFLFWVSQNSFAMEDFNKELESGGWGASLSDSKLTSGMGVGFEFDMRWGRPVTNGFGMGLEFLFASVTGETYYAGGNYGSATKSFNLNTVHFLAKYSGSAPFARFFALNWGLGAGLGGLLAERNYTVDYSGSASNAHMGFTSGPKPVVEVDVGPTFYFPGPQGFVLALRLGYRKFTLDKPVKGRWQSPYSGSGPLTHGFDYSGPFAKFSLGFGNAGGRFARAIAPPAKRRTDAPPAQPVPPPSPF